MEAGTRETEDTVTRKDYIAIAQTLRMTKPPTTDSSGMWTWQQVVYQLAGTLADDNARFDQTRFLKACGVEVTK